MARDKALHALRKREWQMAHKDYYRELAKKQREREKKRMESDSVFYSAFRAWDRAYHALYRRRKQGVTRIFAPRYNKRVPDYAVKGQAVFDWRSAFLIENRVDGMKGWLAETYRERRSV